MEIVVATEPGMVRMTLSGEIDEQGAEMLKAKYREVQSPALKELILDFSRVTYIGSAGIGKLLLFYKDMALKEGGLKVINLPRAIHELFTVLKLDTVFTVLKA
jgi:anti-sigma B factor antagonist